MVRQCSAFNVLGVWSRSASHGRRQPLQYDLSNTGEGFRGFTPPHARVSPLPASELLAVRHVTRFSAQRAPCRAVSNNAPPPSAAPPPLFFQSMYNPHKAGTALPRFIHSFVLVNLRIDKYVRSRNPKIMAARAAMFLQTFTSVNLPIKRRNQKHVDTAAVKGNIEYGHLQSLDGPQPPPQQDQRRV